MNLLRIRIETPEPEFFLPVLFNEIRIEADTGLCIADFIVNLGIAQDYVAQSVMAVFLNGRPVDDLFAAVVRDGDSLSLSGPLPGLVGVSMRKDSPFKWLRLAVTYRGEKDGAQGGNGTVRLKLFNSVLADYGPFFLSRGAMFKAGILLDFFSRSENLGEKMTGIYADAQSLSGVDELCGLLKKLPFDDYFHLTITPDRL